LLAGGLLAGGLLAGGAQGVESGSQDGGGFAVELAVEPDLGRAGLVHETEVAGPVCAGGQAGLAVLFAAFGLVGVEGLQQAGSGGRQDLRVGLVGGLE
jgi:hypothetical protein